MLFQSESSLTSINLDAMHKLNVSGQIRLNFTAVMTLRAAVGPFITVNKLHVLR